MLQPRMIVPVKSVSTDRQLKVREKSIVLAEQQQQRYRYYSTQYIVVAVQVHRVCTADRWSWLGHTSTVCGETSTLPRTAQAGEEVRPEPRGICASRVAHRYPASSNKLYTVNVQHGKICQLRSQKRSRFPKEMKRSTTADSRRHEKAVYFVSSNMKGVSSSVFLSPPPPTRSGAKKKTAATKHTYFFAPPQHTHSHTRHTHHLNRATNHPGKWVRYPRGLSVAAAVMGELGCVMGESGSV